MCVAMPFWSLCANATEIDDQASNTFEDLIRKQNLAAFPTNRLQYPKRDKAFKNVTLSGLSGFSEGHNVVPAETEI